MLPQSCQTGHLWAPLVGPGVEVITGGGGAGWLRPTPWWQAPWSQLS